MIAVAYIRVSSTGQLDGDGPERQQQAITRFAANNNYSITAEFIEDISGTKDAKARAVFQELLDHCSTHNIQHVIIEKPDRISRDMFVGLSIVGDCAAQHLHLIDADTGRDLAHPTGPYEKFVIQILMAAAELNKNVFVHQSKQAKQRLRKQGLRCDGPKPYRESDPLTFNRAKQLRDSGMLYKDIAITLQSENFPTRTGKPWRTGTVHQMLNGRAS